MNQHQSHSASDGLPPLSLPAAKLRVRQHEGVVQVFDELRGKYVALTPEEFVRQHFVAWLTAFKNYPKSLLSNEVTLEINGRRRRCDTVGFSPEGEPMIIVEYKAPTVTITQDVFDQIARYNMALQAKYLIVSNGIQHYCCRMDYTNDTYDFVAEIPSYISLRHPTSEN